MKGRSVFRLCFLLAPLLYTAQSPLIWPLDSPLLVTGNYGELRSSHFHAGLDFSTGGKINKKVYAVEDGYVSRIRVNSGAYGKCVYVTHPNNRVTVYAHLNSFNLVVAEAVSKRQWESQSFEVELLPAPGQIMVKKGEVIGLSGNSGSSSAPHLHFEIRDEKSETPLNPLEIYKLPDSMRPTLEAIGFYDLSDTLQPRLVRAARIHSATVSQTFVIPVKILGIAFMAHDLIRPNGGKNNVYSAELFYDGQLVYSHALRTVDFADNRYVHEFSETSGRFVFQKCFLPTLYPPRLYNFHVDKGRIFLPDTNLHSFRLVLRDEAGNVTERSFSVRSSGGDGYKEQTLSGRTFAECTRDFVYESGEMRIYIPARTLYRSAHLQIEHELVSGTRFSVMPRVNLRGPVVISCKVPRAYADVADKVVLRGTGGIVTSVLRNDSLYFYPKSAGSFVMVADLEPPVIQTALSAKRIARIKKFTSFSFRIRDNLSGISKYSVIINGKWVLAEYDAKNDLLQYSFTDKTPKGPLEFKVEVEDRRGNKKRFVYRLNRQ